MRKELDRLIENMDTVFRGDAWHGPSISEVMQSLKADQIDKKHGFSKRTIGELIFHLVAWRKFLIEKLNDNIHYSLDTEEDNWGTPQITGAEGWVALKAQFQQIHGQLIDLLENFDDDLLDKRVPGEHYDFYKLINGIIQHDTYHLGMIWILWE